MRMRESVWRIFVDFKVAYNIILGSELYATIVKVDVLHILIRRVRCAIKESSFRVKYSGSTSDPVKVRGVI